MTRILLADDHTLVREGLKQILGMAEGLSVQGEASNGAEALTLLRQGNWDVLLLDLSMPGRSGVELIRQIKDEFPRLPVLVLTMHGEQQYAVRALKAGASGYLTKESAAAELVAAVRKVAGGGVYLNMDIAEKIARDFSPAASALPHQQLSDREYSVFRHLAMGRTIGEIAALLCISGKTISTYKTRVQQKMRINNQAELIHYAIKHRLLDESGEGFE
ncbi:MULTISPECIES: response regulator transcription factor [unclassified Achromobacter]|uniref:response regulator n=1 Tax=unclassified Achromobacter TaxID=2626865 RepID=UPI000B51A113|nr:MULTISPECIES: response regulator transcription factor [unclassified Achromobacter]OWT71459.1 DNA-binding response regulator [Achromobacter sp. HZ34]OWT73116.1 DNA-binding response regulator [Achromobacter sp. HZ28]